MTGKHVLVIDDEPEFGEFVRRIAEGLEYEVSVARGPEEFKKAYYTFGPCVIVVDIVMPRVDGIEIMAWLAEQECKAKVLVVTGYNPYYTKFAKLIGTGRGLASVSTFSKPVRAADLRAALS